MSEGVRQLEPKRLWNRFADINAIPRPSKKEDRIVAFTIDFGKKLGLDTVEDFVGNVIIRKPATPGMEDRKTVILQGHLDMVHQKNADTVFDFDSEGIRMEVSGDWVKAQNTTLGADNGLGVAAIMAVLESREIAHPALEALFTVDEETGMTGAMGLEAGILQGEILLNLDTEEDDEIDIGCAGGIDVTASGDYKPMTAMPNGVGYCISINGLQGGHSGMDIHRGLGNANKLMNRLLYELSEAHKIQVAEISGGGLRNAIPRESSALIVVPEEMEKTFEAAFADRAQVIKNEMEVTEPSLEISLSPVEKPREVMEAKARQNLLSAIYGAWNGVYAMSASFPGLVQTSNNIARVEVKEGQITIGCLARSSQESSKSDLSNSLKAVFELAGYKVSFSGDYPGWNPNPESEILAVLKRQYEKLFAEEPRVVACHAGLECGILGRHYPELDMISFGPTIRGAHSPDERASISSVKKFWKFLLNVLEHIPRKN